MKNKAFITKVEQWDKKIILKYNKKRREPVKYLLKFISFFGRETIWLVFLYYFLFIWYDNRVFVYLGTSFLFGLIIVVPIKQKIGRKRPFEVIEEVILLEREQISKSFPSWHLYNVVAQGLTFGFLLNSPLIAILMLLFAFFVGLSRIQLGVHYPSDVIIGYLLGFVGFLLTIFLFGPLFMMMVLYFEQISIHPIYHQQINLMLFTNIWYILLCVACFSLIIYSSLHKIIMMKRKQQKLKN